MQNDRPRTGEVYRCYKAVKKLFRQVCRRNVSNLQKEEYRSIINSYRSSIKAKRRKKSNSSLQPSKLADYYSSIMQDNAKLTEEQQRISIDVHNKYKNNEQYVIESCIIRPSLVSDLISRLKRGSCPGVDGICSEHFIYGNSPTLCETLSCIYSSVINRGCVPKSFLKGII